MERDREQMEGGEGRDSSMDFNVTSLFKNIRSEMGHGGEKNKKQFRKIKKSYKKIYKKIFVAFVSHNHTFHFAVTEIYFEEHL